MEKTKVVKKELPESMYLLIDEDRDLCGPFNKQGLTDEIEASGTCYDEMTAFMVSYDGEKLTFQRIDIEEKESFELIIDGHKESL